tara:strand:+ start:2720 stop:2917 length:198 start_codon:yes stop_codon:yes gene_type:complete
MSQVAMERVLNDVKGRMSRDKEKNVKEGKSPRNKEYVVDVPSPRKILRKNISTDNFMKFQWPWIL